MNPANASSNPLARVPKYAWGLAVVGGLIWVLLGLLILFLPGDPGNRIFFTGDPSSYSTEASNDLIYSARVVGVAFLTAGLLLSAHRPHRLQRRREVGVVWYRNTPDHVVIQRLPCSDGREGLRSQRIRSVPHFMGRASLGAAALNPEFLPRETRRRYRSPVASTLK